MKKHRPDAAPEWRSPLTVVTSALLLYLVLSGFAVTLLPFSRFTQFSVLLHTVAGIVFPFPALWYVIRHWRVRGGGNLSHYQVVGYLALIVLLACCVSGVVLTCQGLFGTRISGVWSDVHLTAGVVTALFLAVHLAMIVAGHPVQADKRRESDLRTARRSFYVGTAAGAGVFLIATVLPGAIYPEKEPSAAFRRDYDWSFGQDRPFAPSLATLEVGQSGRHSEGDPVALAPGTLAGSSRCGTSGCHGEIYEEWLPSAHRYSALDDMFQHVQALMAEETTPPHTRYCAGCHDPISLFSGAKNTANVTLSAEGYDEGASCLVCHSIVRADVQGNADYTLRPPRRYVFEWSEGTAARRVSDFLIRTYPRHHVESYSRPLYKTPEFCGACHKQYIDREVNTDIGRVQGQNQYDSWRKSRWYHEDDPEKTITCRECHMPLTEGTDPAAGDVVDSNRTADDGKHRGHRFLAANQYIPLRHKLEGAETHTAMIQQWLRGEIEIPEIEHKWVTGPVVRLQIAAPESVSPGEPFQVQVVLTNNKAGHDFPTGPLDMIESWVELRVTDENDELLYDAGWIDERGRVNKPPVIFKALGFDREGALIDRHNLWDLVGAKYKRALFPGFTDVAGTKMVCPVLGAPGSVKTEESRKGVFALRVPSGRAVENLHVEAILWYRKANADFLDRVYGMDSGIRSPVTDISRTTADIRVGGGA